MPPIRYIVVLAAESKPPVAIRVRALGGRPLGLRPGSSDVDAFSDNMLDGFHLPPIEIRSDDLARIVEVGTNIGIGLAELAHRYPKARLVGLEPDRDNTVLARRNISPWSDRCTVIEAAAWDSNRTDARRRLGQRISRARAHARRPGDRSLDPRADARRRAGQTHARGRD